MNQKRTPANALLIRALIIFSILIIISQFAVAWYLEKRSERLIKEELNDISFLDASNLDTSMVNKKSVAAQKLDLQFQKLEHKISAIEDKLQREYYYLVTIGFPLTLIGIIGVLISTYRYLVVRAREEVDEAIKPIIQKHESSVLDIIKKYDDEKRLFSEKVILVWGEEDYSEIEKVLDNVEFNMDNLKSYDEIRGGEPYHLLLINNTTGKVLPQNNNNNNNQAEKDKYTEAWNELKSIAENQASSVCIFYYCSTTINFPIWEIKDKTLQARINFATNPSQIYGNLLNSLKYQDHLEDKS